MMRPALFAALAFATVACGNLETREPSVPAGERAPEFELGTSSGDIVSLGELLADGPALIVFYRGHW